MRSGTISVIAYKFGPNLVNMQCEVLFFHFLFNISLQICGASMIAPSCKKITTSSEPTNLVVIWYMFCEVLFFHSLPNISLKICWAKLGN